LATMLTVLFLTACAQPDSAIVAEGRLGEKEERNPERWPRLNLPVQDSADMEEKITELLATMSVEQKVAQVIQPEIRDVTVDDMRRYGFGSYLNGGGSFPGNNKHATVADWVALAEAMYQASIDDSLDGIGIPTMWGTDAVHGHNNVIGATIYPHNIGLGAAHNAELIKEIAQATAEEVMATGIDWVFAPTVAVVRDDRWGRTYEGYSEDPEIVRAYSQSIVEGLQGKPGEGFLGEDRVISTIKHFVGDGGTTNGDDQGDNQSSEAKLISIHAQGYFSGLEAGAQTVMASFNSWQGEKMHGSHYMLTEVLKERMGFDGLVVGDWNGHGQIPGCSNSSCPQALNAGMDILMAPTATWKPLYENTVAQVQNGEIPMVRLNDAVTRILRVKMRAGLFEKTSPAKRPLAGQTSLIGSEKHREIAQRAVRQSLVLLKNNQNILPLAPKQRVFVTGDAADNIGKQAGGWTITWQGTNNVNADFPGGSSIYSGIKTTVENAGGQVELGRDHNYKVRPDVAIVVFGEEPYAEGNGDLDNLEYQRGNKHDLALLKHLKMEGIPVVSLFVSGRPLWVNPELNASDAFVASWLPGSEGKAIADVLFTSANGKMQYDFVGSLPYSWPRFADQTSVNWLDTDYNPLLPYGFGLRYGDTDMLATNLDELASKNGTVSISARPIFSGGVKKPWSVMLKSQGETQKMVSNMTDLNGLKVRTADRNVQEDALKIQWGKEKAQLQFFADFPVDMRAYGENKASISFDVQRLTSVTKPVVVTYGNSEVDITEPVATLSSGEWKTISVDLNCFRQQGVVFEKTYAPFGLISEGMQGVKLAEVWIKPYSVAAATLVCNN